MMVGRKEGRSDGGRRGNKEIDKETGWELD